nr:uncharacterized protein LOC109167340 [Ipomoea batatas]
MVDITEDDVVIVLGFPRGTIEIERKKKKKGASFPLRTEFKEKLQANDAEKVSYPALIEAMLECNNGDSPQNGSVGTQDRIEARYAPTTADSATAAGISKDHLQQILRFNHSVKHPRKLSQSVQYLQRFKLGQLMSCRPSFNLGFTPTPLDAVKCSCDDVANIVLECATLVINDGHDHLRKTAMADEGRWRWPSSRSGTRAAVERGQRPWLSSLDG